MQKPVLSIAPADVNRSAAMAPKSGRPSGNQNATKSFAAVFDDLRPGQTAGNSTGPAIEPDAAETDGKLTPGSDSAADAGRDVSVAEARKNLAADPSASEQNAQGVVPAETSGRTTPVATAADLSASPKGGALAASPATGPAAPEIRESAADARARGPDTPDAGRQADRYPLSDPRLFGADHRALAGDSKESRFPGPTPTSVNGSSPTANSGSMTVEGGSAQRAEGTSAEGLKPAIRTTGTEGSTKHPNITPPEQRIAAPPTIGSKEANVAATPGTTDTRTEPSSTLHAAQMASRPGNNHAPILRESTPGALSPPDAGAGRAEAFTARQPTSVSATEMGQTSAQHIRVEAHPFSRHNASKAAAAQGEPTPPPTAIDQPGNTSPARLEIAPGQPGISANDRLSAATRPDPPSAIGEMSSLRGEFLPAHGQVSQVERPHVVAEATRLPVSQIADVLARQPERPLEIRLSPDELGRVRMTMSTTETGVTVVIVAERQETLDLMRRYIDQFAMDLRRMGYEQVGFDFRGGGTDRQSEHDPSADKFAGQSGARDAEGSDLNNNPAPVARVGATQGLDLRV